MEVKKIVEGMTAPQVAQVIDENFNALNGEKATVEAVADVQKNVNRSDDNTGVLSYPEYSSTEPVAVGDVRRYEGLLYRSKEAGAYDWDPEKWERVTLKQLEDEKLSELGSKLNNSNPQIYQNSLNAQVGGNLFNKNAIGIIKDRIFYDTNNDKYKENTGYNISEFISVIPNEIYSIDSRVLIKGYNKDMVFITSLTLDETKLVIPNDIYWIRFSYYGGWADAVYVNQGDVVSPIFQFGKIPTEKIKDGSIGKEKLTTELSNEINNISVLDLKTKNSVQQVHVNAIASQLGGNLFNKNGFGIIKDYFFKDVNTDKLYEKERYNTSEFIAVEPNVNYLIDERVNIRGYDVNMNHIGKLTAVDNTLAVPDNVYWIRFSYYGGWSDSIYLNKGDSKDLKYGLIPSEKIKDGSVGEEKLSDDVKSKLNQQGGIIQSLKTGSYVKRGALLNGDTWEHPKNSVEVGECITFSAQIIGEFGTLYIGHGKITGAYIKITSNEVVLCSHAVSPMSEKVYQHGLTIENNIQVCIEKEKNTTVSIRITSNGKQSAAFSDGYWYGNKGTPFVENDGCDLANCSFGWTSKGITSDIWAFGDSYFGVNGTIRWMAYLISAGHTNLIVNAFGGQESISAYEDLTNLFQIGTPKKLLWCLGMNDVDSSTSVNSNWLNTFNLVKSLCESNNIELILATIPTVPARINKYKNEIVRNSGYRYIDFDKAVGANETTGEWFSDMLYSDGIHPSETGALALYHQAIADMPELLNC